MSDNIDWLRVQFCKYGTTIPVDMDLISVYIKYSNKISFREDNLIYNPNDNHYLQSNYSYYLFENNFCNNPDFLKFDHLLFQDGRAVIYINLTNYHASLPPNSTIKVKIEGKYFLFSEGYTTVKTPETYNEDIITFWDIIPSTGRGD